MKSVSLTILPLILVGQISIASTKNISPQILVRQVSQFAAFLDGIDSCTLEIRPKASGLFLAVDSEEDGHVEITLQTNDLVQLAEKLSNDGSFQRIYQFAHNGKLELIHADDAYDEATLTDSEGNKSTCAVHY